MHKRSRKATMYCFTANNEAYCCNVSVLDGGTGMVCQSDAGGADECCASDAMPATMFSGDCQPAAYDCQCNIDPLSGTVETYVDLCAS